MLGEAQRICNHKGNHPRFFRGSFSLTANYSAYEDRLGSTDEMIRILGGTLKKSTMNTNPILTRNEGLGICDDP